MLSRLVGPGRYSPWAVLAILAAHSLTIAAASEPSSGRVHHVKTPDKGIQPQATIDENGTIHLVYYKGDLVAGDVWYTTRKSGDTGFAQAVRVNSEAGSAVARGTMRGAQIAVGRDGRAHVAWNGSTKARPANPNGGAPMLYARSQSSASGFEPQRNLMKGSAGLDGGGTVAADARGHVIVAWHGLLKDDPALAKGFGDATRKLLVVRSSDDGETFSPEQPALTRETGACPCCGTRALMGKDGEVHILYRAATKGLDRDMTLLNSHDGGDHFEGVRADAWPLNTCPMSSSSLSESRGKVVAGWETRGQVFLALLDPKTGAPANPFHPRGAGGNRKHPAVAINLRGEILAAWAEDTTFTHGGALAWRVFDAEGKSTDETGRLEDGIPLSSLPTAVAHPNGDFTIIH